MDFTSLAFLLCFLPVLFGIYCAIDSKTGRNVVLLLGSFVFYGFYDVKYILILLLCIGITALGGNLGYMLFGKKSVKSGKIVIITALILNIAMLAVCKYTNFALANINMLLAPFGKVITAPKILLPIGLSFFVFQSTSYLFDILAGRITPERNLISYALFVSFFPTITSGPIQRAGELLPQINQKRELSWNRFCHALILFLWGAFLKMVVADRLGNFTGLVFGDFSQYGFWILLTATLAYAVQIYADFAGYSAMAIALAKLFGFDLDENFNQPYAATSIAEFWRRWHISLSGWLRDYIYIPLGGNRKGTARKYLNLLIVFLVSGLWHGASWNFVLWGAIHAFYQIIGGVTKKYRVTVTQALGVNTKCFSYRLLQRFVVFLLVSFAWIFFRIETMKQAVSFISTMLTRWDIDMLLTGGARELGLDAITISSVMVLLIVSILKEKGITIADFLKQNLLFRCSCCFVLILVIVLFGAYGPAFSASDFIYAGF